MNDPYQLQTEDLEYLNSNYSSRWKKTTEGYGKHGLIIENYCVPTGYTVAHSNLMILIPIGYPGSALDMFYFSPRLEKEDGSGINALAQETHFGETWQRWSRHYKWNPDNDSLVKHIEFVWHQLKREIQR